MSLTPSGQYKDDGPFSGTINDVKMERDIPCAQGAAEVHREKKYQELFSLLRLFMQTPSPLTENSTNRSSIQHLPR